MKGPLESRSVTNVTWDLRKWGGKKLGMNKTSELLLVVVRISLEL